MVRKALIPIAGRATRLAPLSEVVPKAMFPLVDGTGQIASVLHVILQEAVSAGVEQVGIVWSPWQAEIVEKYISIVANGDFGRVPASIEFITQESPRGFGDAVLRGCSFVGAEPFMLFLGDHVYIEKDGEPSCGSQTAAAFGSVDAAAVIGVQEISTGDLRRVGVVKGVEIGGGVYRCTDFIEKPDPGIAGRRLVTEGLPDGAFLAHGGIYVFSPEIFDCLRQISAAGQKGGAEIELSDAQALLMNKNPNRYLLYKFAGRAYDVGTPAGYAEAVSAFRERGRVV
jgi:UTP--glucose-1-phosphate uridylyltransferase